jgi:hypothetical protein
MKKLMTVAFLGLAALAACAEDGKVDRSWRWSPLGVGIAAPIQLPFTDTDIYGLRVGGIFGWNRNVYGLDTGVVSLNNGEFSGIQGSVFNWSSSDVYGIQAGALANVVHGSFYGIQVGTFNLVYVEPTCGIQIGGLFNYNGAFSGIQLAVLNWESTYFNGWQIGGFANVVKEDSAGFALGAVNYHNKIVGFQCGAVNVAEECTGLQLGLFNGANKISGVQIGVLNLICTEPLFSVPVMPVVNASF